MIVICDARALWIIYRMHDVRISARGSVLLSQMDPRDELPLHIVLYTEVRKTACG